MSDDVSDRESEYMQKFVSDDQLRAECERRFGNEYGARDERWDGLVKKAQAETERVAKRAAIASAAVIEREERDEWKRRAEVAEAKVENYERGVRECLELRAQIQADMKLASTVTFTTESGPGIAAMRPDTSVAFLDEDLLCDDA
jgi:hypothetical protein